MKSTIVDCWWKLNETHNHEVPNLCIQSAAVALVLRIATGRRSCFPTYPVWESGQLRFLRTRSPTLLPRASPRKNVPATERRASRNEERRRALSCSPAWIENKRSQVCHRVKWAQREHGGLPEASRQREPANAVVPNDRPEPVDRTPKRRPSLEEKRLPSLGRRLVCNRVGRSVTGFEGSARARRPAPGLATRGNLPTPFYHGGPDLSSGPASERPDTLPPAVPNFFQIGEGGFNIRFQRAPHQGAPITKGPGKPEPQEAPPGFEPGYGGFAIRCLSRLATAP